MKVTFEFDYYEDKEEFEIFQQARKMHRLLWDFSHNMKRRIANLPENQVEGYEKAMEDFFEMASEHKVDLE